MIEVFHPECDFGDTGKCIICGDDVSDYDMFVRFVTIEGAKHRFISHWRCISDRGTGIFDKQAINHYSIVQLGESIEDRIRHQARQMSCLVSMRTYRNYRNQGWSRDASRDGVKDLWKVRKRG